MGYRGKDSLCQVHRSTNGRRISGPFGRLGEALRVAARDPRLRALSIGELNPTRSAGDPEAIPASSASWLPQRPEASQNRVRAFLRGSGPGATRAGARYRRPARPDLSTVRKCRA
jgi:hypothetical protein